MRDGDNGGVPPTSCPCLSGLTYAECCGRFHTGQAEAPTAEALMRSRFSAFATGDVAYLLHSWHPDTRPETLELDDTLRWYRLDILDTVAGSFPDSTGVVEFAAYWKRKPGQDPVPEGEPRNGMQQERSRFARHDRRWVYIDDQETA